MTLSTIYIYIFPKTIPGGLDLLVPDESHDEAGNLPDGVVELVEQLGEVVVDLVGRVHIGGRGVDIPAIKLS